MRRLNGDGFHNNMKVLLRDTSHDRSPFLPSSCSSCGWLHKRRRDYRQGRVILLWHTVVMVVRHRGIPHTDTTRRRCGGKHTIHGRISRPINWLGNVRIRTLNFQSRQDTVKMLDKLGGIVRRHMNVPEKSSIVIAMIEFLSMLGFYGGGSSSTSTQHTGNAGQTGPQPMDS